MPIPTIVVGGFLGSGKTTLLRRLLTNPAGIRYGVLLNDFGALDIDGATLARDGASRIVLDNGCICCTVPDSLTEALDTLLASDPPPDRIVIETSGISRPLPVAASLESRVQLDGLYCVIDADAFSGLDFADTELALDQATGADLVLLNKADLAGPARLAAVASTLRGAMPRIRTLPTVHAAVPADLLFSGHVPLEPSHHHHDPHADIWQTWCWQSAAPLDRGKLRRTLNALPPGVLRAKGETGTVRFQTVGKRVYITEDGHEAADTAVIAVGRRGAFDPAALTALFAACEA